MKHETLLFIVIGSAVVGVAYYLVKQEKAATPTSSGILSGVITSIQNSPSASLAVDSELGLTGLAGWIYGQSQ